MTYDIHEFLNDLAQKKIYFTLGYVRENSIMAYVTGPGERWECEFFKDGHVEIEIFKSDGCIIGEEAIQDLFNRFSD